MKALITGVTGQDGWYLSKYLEKQGYKVYGGHRRSQSKIPPWVEPIELEMTEYECVRKAIQRVKPDEIYNLAAQSFVGASFQQPIYTHNVNGAGVVRILESIAGTEIRLYQASTSEMFGNAPAPQSEATRMEPVSPYGMSKLYAHQMAALYRRSYKVKVSCGILFNHESPLRGQEFVTQKIARAFRLENPKVSLGNLDSERDFGHAIDYVKMMHLMLQNEPDDYVIGSGCSFSIKEIIEVCEKLTEKKLEVKHNPKFERPAEVHRLEADITKAIDKLGWSPVIGIDQLMEDMIKVNISKDYFA